MPRHDIHTDAAPASPSCSQGVVARDHVYVSGMVGIDPATGELPGPNIKAQTGQAWPTAWPSWLQRERAVRTSSRSGSC